MSRLLTALYKSIDGSNKTVVGAVRPLIRGILRVCEDSEVQLRFNAVDYINLDKALLEPAACGSYLYTPILGSL